MVPSSSLDTNSDRRGTRGDISSRTPARYVRRTTIPCQDQMRGLIGRVAWLAAVLLLVLFGAALAAEGSQTEEVKLVPSADTFISAKHQGRGRDERDRNFGSKEGLEVAGGKGGRSGSFGGWKGTLIRFDLSGLPSGAEVEEARVFLYHYNHEGGVVSIHRMERAWMELGASWSKPCRGCEVWWRGWERGNYQQRAADTRRVREKGWFSWDVTEDVRSFSRGIPNYGWFLKPAMSQGNDSDSARFYSRETSHKKYRPYLRVRFRSSLPLLTVRITSPANGAVLHENPVNVIGTVSDPSASLNVNGVVPSILENTFQASLNLTEGANSIAVVAQDRYGQTASDRIEVSLVTRGSIAGTVVDSITGLPLASAEVSVMDSLGISHAALTGIDGKYLISSVPFGTFSGSITKGGYRAYSFSGTISAGQAMILDAGLSPILPLISDVAALEVTSDSATISWVTDQPADSLVEYGPTLSYGSSVADSILVTAHRVTLRNLTPKTIYHFRVRSANGYGFSSYSVDSSFTTLDLSNPITLQIKTPKNDDTILRADVRVEGVVTNAMANETGVVVNGVLASVYGDSFVANHVPLLEGANTITAIATDVDGHTARASVVVNGVEGENYLRISAGSESGICPFETVLTLESSLDLAGVSLTHTGPAEVELLSISASEYRVKITTEGTYNFTAKVADTTGTLYEDTVTVAVFSREEVDSLLRGKWEGVRLKLAAGDVEGSLAFFSDSAKGDYRELFTALTPVLPEIVQEMSDIELIECTRDAAIYDIRTVRKGVDYSFQLLFIKDAQGIWKVDSF
jgi:hypothetical protein